jgi:chromosome partitioning protein
MKVIVVANQKGGVGKTTIATHLACLSAAEGLKVSLIDADSQASSMNFRRIRSDALPQFQSFSILSDTIHKDVIGLDADRVIIDVGGRDNRIFRSALLAADTVIIPITPSQYDIWSSEDTFKMISEIKLMKDNLKAVVVLNQVINGTNVSKEVIEVMHEFVKKYQLNVCNTKLFSRVAYKESVSEGMAVTEIREEKYKKAADEIKEFYREVLDYAN